MDLIGPRRLKAFGYEPRNFEIYEKEEADEEGIEYHSDPLECEPHDWLLTPDGFVCQVISIRTMGKGEKKSYEYKLPYCRFFLRDDDLKHRLERIPSYLDYKHTRGALFGNSSAKNWAERVMGRKKVQLAIKQAASFIVANQGTQLTPEQLDFVGNMFRPDKPEPGLNAARLLRQPEVVQFLTNEITKLLDSRGIDAGAVVDKYEEAYDIAKEIKRPGDMIAVADRYSKMIGLDKPNNNQQIEVEADWEDVDLEIESNKRRELSE